MASRQSSFSNSDALLISAPSGPSSATARAISCERFLFLREIGPQQRHAPPDSARCASAAVMRVRFGAVVVQRHVLTRPREVERNGATQPLGGSGDENGL